MLEHNENEYVRFLNIIRKYHICFCCNGLMQDAAEYYEGQDLTINDKELKKCNNEHNEKSKTKSLETGTKTVSATQMNESSRWETRTMVPLKTDHSTHVYNENSDHERSDVINLSNLDEEKSLSV